MGERTEVPGAWKRVKYFVRILFIFKFLDCLLLTGCNSPHRGLPAVEVGRGRRLTGMIGWQRMVSHVA